MTAMRYIDEYLQHYGVKGQKWGVRRSARQLAKAGGHLPAKQLSDAELKARVDRLNLEANYARLTAKKKGVVQQMVHNTMKTEGGKAVALLGVFTAGVVGSKAVKIGEAFVAKFMMA